MPGRPLDEIWAELIAYQGPYDLTTVPAILAIGPALAVAGLALIPIRLRDQPWTAAGIYLALLVLGVPGYWIASFSPGMNLADTFAINGGDYSPWAMPLYLTSAAAFVGLLAVAIVGPIVHARNPQNTDYR